LTGRPRQKSLERRHLAGGLSKHQGTKKFAGWKPALPVFAGNKKIADAKFASAI
jgi:hypothetical protein